MTSSGEQVNVPLVNLRCATAIANGTLTGSEEAIDNYGFRMTTGQERSQDRSRKTSAIQPTPISRPLLPISKELIKNDRRCLPVMPLEATVQPCSPDNGQRCVVDTATTTQAIPDDGHTDRVLFERCF